MFQFTESLEVDHAATVVWPYLVAFEQVPLWEDGVLEVRRLSPGPLGVGTVIAARRVFGRRETELHGEIESFVDGRSATLVLRGGPLRIVRAEYAVDPIDDRRSRVTYRGSGELAGPLRLLHPLIGSAGRRIARGNLASLRARIDAGIAPDSPAGPAGPAGPGRSATGG